MGDSPSCPYKGEIGVANILHLAPIGSGKTRRVLSLLRELSETRRAMPPTVWVLLATRRQELSLRQRLIEGAGAASAYFNIEFFNFYSLNARLLKIAGKPVRRLNNVARQALLRRLLAEMLADDQLDYFHRIADKRGFAAVLAELIDELKQASVDVDEFAAAARSDKDREIAKIYRRYQDMLRRSDLADVEGEGWLALATLRARPDIAAHVDRLLVDGYDQFTLVQAQLLAALSRSIQGVHITLTDDPAARYQALPHRSALARKRLQAAFADAGLALEQETIEPASAERHPDLENLSKNIFRGAPAASQSDAIHLMAMPNPAEEVKSVLRSIKGKLLADVSPDDMLVALRDWDRYAAHFEAGGREYGLPLLLHQERALDTSPVIAALIDLLRLPPHFRRRELLDVLHSPYIDTGLSEQEIDLLERLSLKRRLLGGPLSAWLDLINSAGQAIIHEGDDPQPTVLTPAQADELRTRLSAFFHGITPPDRADASTYVSWLDQFLGGRPPTYAESPASENTEDRYALNIIRNVWDDRDANASNARRNLNALVGLKRIMGEFLASADALRATFGSTSDLDWRQFLADLVHALESTAADPNETSRAGRILVTTATEARGLIHRHIYVPGLAEGLFPSEAAEDPLYLDSEREGLQARGIPLATQSERVDDQGLFYELISLPQESLTLSRPTLKAGKTWLESHLWRAVKAVFPKQPITSRPLGAVIQPPEAASGAELLLAVADQLNGSDPQEATSALRMHSWILLQENYAKAWQRIVDGRRIERGRLSFSPHDEYSGILTRPALLAAAAGELGSERVWSASQLKDYGLCGFRFFARRLLNLEAASEPEAGIDALQFGQLSHAILEATYRRIRTNQLEIHENNLDKALAIFHEQAEALLQDAPAEFGFRASATWKEEAELLRKRLAALVELDFSPKSPLRRFGHARQVRMLEHRFDDAWIEMPGDMPPIRVSGVIDRVDWADDELVLVDYKTGSGAISRRQMELGRDFQMAVYALALDWANPGGSRLSGGLFWRLRNLKPSGVYSADNDEDQAALEMARQHIAFNLRQGRRGRFPVDASQLEGGKCASYCEYSHFCRLRVTNRHKPIPQS